MEKRKKTKTILMIAMLSLAVAACGDEEMPEAPQRSDEIQDGDVVGKAGGAAGAVSFEHGAPGGASDIRQLVDSCGREGFFYDRVASQCDHERVVPFAGNSYDLVMRRTEPTDRQRQKIDFLLAELEGYLFDQVVSIVAEGGLPARYEIHLVKFLEDGRTLVSKMTLERD